ncbi:hypothetical protein [Cellulosimicrobium sp. Marseille-Q8652]
MPTPDLIQGVDLPIYDDPPAIPDDLALIYYALLQRAVPRFSNTAARNTAYPSPTDGQLAVTGSGTSLVVWAAVSGTWRDLWRASSDVPISSRSAETRRSTSGSFSSGSMTTLANVSLPSSAPAGLYRIEWLFVLSSSTPTSVFLRGSADGNNLTTDLQVTAVSEIRAWTIPTLYTHTGGTMPLVLAAQSAGGTTTAPAGSRIVATWEGPA